MTEKKLEEGNEVVLPGSPPIDIYFSTGIILWIFHTAQNQCAQSLDCKISFPVASSMT